MTTLKIVSVIPDFDQTGEMRAPYQILKGLVQAGWETEILTIASDNNVNVDKAWDCVLVRKVHASTRRRGLIRLARQLLNRPRDTVVLSWVWDWSNVGPLMAKWLSGKPWVVCLDGYAHRHAWHGTDWRTQTRLELRYGTVIRNASFVIAESPSAYDRVRSVYPTQSVDHVPFCLWRKDLESVEAGWEQEDLNPERRPIILFTGRLVRRKGAHDLISAFGRLAQKYPDWAVELRGPIDDPGYYAELQRLAVSHGIESRICFAPPLSGESLFKRYRSTSIFCLPSTGEGMPTVITEAMYFGGAIVAGVSGAVPYQLGEDDSCGLLIRYGDVDQLTSSLDRLMFNEGLREDLMRCARQRALDVFTWEQYFPSLEARFRALVADQIKA